jgi:hypothetical protein
MWQSFIARLLRRDSGRDQVERPDPSALAEEFTVPVIARSGTTKQSSRFDWLKVPSLSRDWIATARFAHLAMTGWVISLGNSQLSN